METLVKPRAESACSDGLLRINEAADFLGLDKLTIYRLIYKGELASVRIGRSRRVPRRALVEFAERRLVQKDA